MLNVLLESRANGERRRGGTVASVALHTMVIVGAVVATASGRPAPPRQIVIPDVITWQRPEPPPLEARVEPGKGSASADAVARPAPAPPVQIDFSKIPTGIPPVSDARILDPDGLLPRGPSLPENPYASTGAGTSIGSEPYQPDAVELLATLLPPAPSPAYPDMLRRAGVTGRVVVRFVVDTTGRVELPGVLILSSAHDLLEQEVRRVLPRYRFRPAEVGGKKVRMMVELPFEFSLR